jgi:hypothetical protein
LLDHGRWFSSGTSASSTTKTGRHDIAEILLKVALNTINQPINHLLPFVLSILFLLAIALSVLRFKDCVSHFCYFQALLIVDFEKHYF